jgi:hypothetical protein
MGRSFLALLSGYATIVIIVLVLTPLAARLLIPAEMLAAKPPQLTSAYLASNFVYGFGAAVLGGWLTAMMAPRKPMAHAGALAVVLLAFAAIGMLGAADGGTEAAMATGQPPWYGPGTAVVGILGALAGGWLRSRGRVVEA